LSIKRSVRKGEKNSQITLTTSAGTHQRLENLDDCRKLVSKGQCLTGESNGSAGEGELGTAGRCASNSNRGSESGRAEGKPGRSLTYRGGSGVFGGGDKTPHRKRHRAGKRRPKEKKKKVGPEEERGPTGGEGCGLAAVAGQEGGQGFNQGRGSRSQRVLFDYTAIKRRIT